MKKLLVGLIAAWSLSLALLTSMPALAEDCVTNPNGTGCPCAVNPNSSLCQGNEMNDSNRLPTIGKNIINTALYIVGILAVAMIIFSGIRYITAAGNKSRLEQSKQILIYSVMGLLVALIAYALVNYVVGLFSA